jgi:hypothetical protein
MKRRILWVALILTALLALAWPLIPVPSAALRLAAIPTSGPDFQSQPLELTADDRAFLGEAQAVQFLISMRGGGRLVLTVIDGSRNRHAVHDPGYCFSGAGRKIQSERTVTVPSGSAAWVSTVKDNEKTETLWFFDDGRHQFTSLFEYWLATSSRRATIGRSGAEPILVTLRSLPDEPVNWDRVRQILLPALGFR